MERINTLINDSAANASSVIKQIPQVAETMHTKVTSLTGFLSGKESPTGGDGQNGNVNDEGENRSSSFGVLIAGTVICVAATVPAVMLWHKTYEGKAARKKEEAKSLANQKERHTLSILGSKLAAVVQDSITSLFVTPSPLSSLSSLQALSWKPLTSLFNQSSYRSNSDGRTITIQGRRNVCEQEAKERVDELIQGLGLIRHPEGGYFKEIYRSGAEPMASKGIGIGKEAMGGNVFLIHCGVVA